jgi:transposase
MELTSRVAGIDVHKSLLVVVVGRADLPERQWKRRQFGATTAELRGLAEWLQSHGVREVVMESTAQYWKPVWMALEGSFRLHLAQALSAKGPRGRKWDYRDATRLVKRLLSDDLALSFVPDAEQRRWRLLTRTRYQITRDRVRLRNQMEGLLEEGQIKLSSVVSDLFGASGRRILAALANGESDPARLAALGDEHLRVTEPDLQAALCGQLHATHRTLLQLALERLELMEQQLATVDAAIAQALAAHQEVVERLCQVPGIGVQAAQQILAEVGPQAAAFPSAPQLASWVGVCPGRQESAGESTSNRSAKGNRPLRRVLNQVAWAAVKCKDSFLQLLFRRWVPRLGVKKAIWAVAHRVLRLVWKVLHEGVRYQERGPRPLTPQALRRRRARLLRELRQLGYAVTVSPQLESVAA